MNTSIQSVQRLACRQLLPSNVSVGKNKFLWVILAVLIGSSGASSAEVVGEILALGFVEKPLSGNTPPPGANGSSAFSVRLSEGKLMIESSRSGHAPKPAEQVVKNIRYQGVNNGEWGGELAAVWPNGQRRVLVKDNIQAMVPTSTRLLVFAGLAHLGITRGAVYGVRDPAATPSMEKLTLLPDAPEVVLADTTHRRLERFFIIGSSSLMRFESGEGEASFEVLLWNQFWRGLYPNSAVLSGGTLVIGLRSGVATVDIAPWGMVQAAPRYFVPKKS